MIWDKGTWEPEPPDIDAALRKGEITFNLYGKKLKGSWVLVRTRGYGGNSSRPSWLLIKHRDQYASTRDIAEEEPYWVVSGCLLADIARYEGVDVGQAATGDPVAKVKRTRATKSVARCPQQRR